MPDRLDLSIRLRDGRTLGYADLGDPQGIPLLHFHGFPGSRYEGIPLDKPAKKCGVRVIAPERPGMGLSTFQPERKMVDWPQDMLELADALGLDKFAVSGISGGGPYALACAWKIPERLTGTTLMAGVGPFSEPDATQGMKKDNIRLFATARKTPWMLYPVFWIMKASLNEKAMVKMMKSMPEADRKAAQREPEFEPVMLKDAREAFASGVRGSVHEAVLYANAWGFPLGEIRSKVHLWQGEDDVNVPPVMGRYQARALPNCVAHFLPGEGHLSLALNHAEEILETIKNP